MAPQSTKITNMHKVLTITLIAGLSLVGCNKSKTASASGGPSSAVSSDDPVQKRLQELAGNGAKNCGVISSQAAADVEPAGKCAVDSAKAKKPFYVEYQMPGMNVAVAGNEQGKLFSVQSQAGGAGLTTADCPAELRIAPSGRVTCAGAGSHTGMSGMGSGSGSALPAGHPSPHSSDQSKPPSKP
jgi:hypothetical protein